MNEMGQALKELKSTIENSQQEIPDQYADRVDMLIQEKVRKEGIVIAGGKWESKQLGPDGIEMVYRVYHPAEDINANSNMVNIYTEYTAAMLFPEDKKGKRIFTVRTFGIPSGEANLGGAPHKQEVIFDKKMGKWVPLETLVDSSTKNGEFRRKEYTGEISKKGLRLWPIEASNTEAPKKAPKLLDKLFRRATVGK